MKHDVFLKNISHGLDLHLLCAAQPWSCCILCGSLCLLIFFHKIKSLKTGAGPRVLVRAGPALETQKAVSGAWVMHRPLQHAWWRNARQGCMVARLPGHRARARGPSGGKQGPVRSALSCWPAPPWAFVFLLFPLGHSPLKIISSPGKLYTVLSSTLAPLCLR